MKLYPSYGATDDEVIALLDAAPMVRLVTRTDDGWPDVGLYVFTRSERTIEIHLERSDRQLASLRSEPRALIAVDDILAFAPSHWIDPEDASHADHYYRSATIRGAIEIREDPESLSDHFTRLLGRYQPEGGHRPVSPVEPLYTRSLARVALVRFTVTSMEAKFKLGQRTPRRNRASILEALTERGGSADARTAGFVRSALSRDDSPSAHP